MRRRRAWVVASVATALVGLLSASARGGDTDARRVEEVVAGVVANYYAEPDVDAMLRGALLGMVQTTPRARFDSTTNDARYRVRLGRSVVSSVPHAEDSRDLVASIVKVADTLAQRTSTIRSALIDAALRGAVIALEDCYTIYLTSDFVSHLSFGPGEAPADIGLSLVCGPGGRVRHVRPGSPAFLAGIELEDRVTSVDGRSCENLDAAETFALLSGPRNTPIQIGLTRTSGVRLVVELSRRSSSAGRPRTQLLGGGRLRYVRPGLFESDTTLGLTGTLGCERLDGVIVDLRANGGGRVDEAERFARLFLEPGPIASIEGRGGQNLGQLSAHSIGACAAVPVVVLVDRETASAAELVAQALRERRRAPLIGQPTFGKGTVQKLLHFSDGSVARVTTARYLSPSGKPLDRFLEPDVILPHAGLDLGGDVDPTLDPAVRVAVLRLLPSRPPPGAAQGK